MTRMPGTEWRPVDAYTPGDVTRPPNGMVVHTAVTPATVSALDGLVNGFSKTRQVSAYFAVGVDGHIIQCVDLDNKAWTQAAGNHAWVGVENVGDGTKAPLTAQQVTANAQILAWLHTTYGVPLARTDDVNGHGLGWHGMGGTAWGGHPICPGEYVRAQLDLIVAQAAELVNGKPPAPKPEKKMDHVWIGYVQGSDARYILGAGTKHHIGSSTVYKEWSAQAAARGLDVLERPCTQAFLDDLTTV